MLTQFVVRELDNDPSFHNVIMRKHTTTDVLRYLTLAELSELNGKIASFLADRGRGKAS